MHTHILDIFVFSYFLAQKLQCLNISMDAQLHISLYMHLFDFRLCAFCNFIIGTMLNCSLIKKLKISMILRGRSSRILIGPADFPPPTGAYPGFVVWGVGRALKARRATNEAPPALREVGCREGVSLSRLCPLSRKNFFTSERKMAHFGAFWVIFLQ